MVIIIFIVSIASLIPSRCNSKRFFAWIILVVFVAIVIDIQLVVVMIVHGNNRGKIFVTNSSTTSSRTTAVMIGGVITITATADAAFECHPRILLFFKMKIFPT